MASASCNDGAMGDGRTSNTAADTRQDTVRAPMSGPACVSHCSPADTNPLVWTDLVEKVGCELIAKDNQTHKENVTMKSPGTKCATREIQKLSDCFLHQKTQPRNRWQRH